MRACPLLFALGLLGCQSIPEPVQFVPGRHIEIWVFRCASESELRYGDTGAELWGEGWHYIEKLLRCNKA